MINSKECCEELRKQAIKDGLPWFFYEAREAKLMPESRWDTLPDFYAEHVAEKNAKVKRLMAEMQVDETFVYFTDAHVRENRMASVPIIRSILQNTNVETVFYGGDTVSAWATDESLVEDVTYFAKAYAFAKPYMVRGNHDMYGKEFEYTDVGAVKTNVEVYELIFQEQEARVNGIPGKTYYYIDHDDSKIRYIVIDTNELLIPGIMENGTWNCDVSITKEQIDWFVDLLNRTPEDYEIVVLGHTPFYPELRHAFPKACIFGKLIEAYNQKTTLATESWNGEDAFFVKADFTHAKGRVFFTVCGHGHIDDTYISKSGCINYEVHCDAVEDNNGGSPYPREEGTITESVVDVILIDRTNQRIEVVRYGAGIDRTWM